MADPPRFSDYGSHLAVLRAAALQAVEPAAAVQRHLAPADYAEAARVFIAGAGKAGAAMARGAAEILGERLARGVMAVPRAPAQPLARVAFVEAGHPTPTQGSLAAGRAIAEVLAEAGKGDLVLALISGGGSALLELPMPGLSLADLQATNAALLKSGAAIHEVNVVRTQLSQIKGGGLARLAHPARGLSLILSDVVGNPLDIIASGPTALSAATRRDALAIVDKYGLRAALPSAVRAHLSAEGGAPPKAPPDIENRLVGSNRLAGEAAVAAARALGFEAHFLADDWQGEARAAGERFGQLVAAAAGDAKRGRCLVVGGETTVVVRGGGRGGRNQEAALAAAAAVDGLAGVVIATFATDGVDGPTDAAGAVVTGDTLPRARAQGLEAHRHLADNDAYPFFAALGDLVITGPTGTNVNDLMFGLVY